MTDVHDNKTRSYNMSRIRSQDTKPEMIVRKYLHAKGLRYILHNKKLLGKPDLTLPRYRIVIFVNGCFWHYHKDCKYFVMPKTRTEWWREKIEGTMKRDEIAKAELKELGWEVLVIWECELMPEKRDMTMDKIYKRINKIEGIEYAEREQ